MVNIDKKYLQYAEDVVSGRKVACEFIKLACRRYLSWFERDDMYFDPEAVDKVVRFISKLKHTAGKHAGKPFILSDWQFWMTCNIYGFKWKKDDLRVIRKVYIEVGRKNGKTAYVAALCLYHLIADGEGQASIILAANSAKQATLCFNQSKSFVKPFLAAKLFKTYRDSITFDATESKLQVVAADASRLDGENASFFVCDELHAAPNSSVWDVLESSQGMREQPLAVAITTAGFNRSGICTKVSLI